MYKVVCLKSKKEFSVCSGKPLLLGRGLESGCLDKRVSRKHAELTVGIDGSLEMIALSTNPCFLMKSGRPPIHTIKKNHNVTIRSGDYISLLPDSTWFEVVADVGPKPEDNRDSRESTPDNVVPVSSSPVPLSSNQQVPSFSPLLNVSILDEPEYLSRQNYPSSPNLLSTDAPLEDTGIGTDTNIAAASCLSPPSRTRKLSLSMYEIDDEPPSKRQVEMPPPDTAEAAPPVPSTSCDVTVTAEIDFASENGDLLAAVLDCADTNADKPHIPDDEAVATAAVDGGNTIPNEPSIHDVDQPLTVPPSVGANEEVGQPGTAEPTVKVEDSSAIVVGVRVKTDPDQVAGAPVPAANQPVQPQGRPLCQYEGSCYRRNVQHKTDYSHPGDADWVSADQRPACPYGSSCFRRNKAHRVSYRHPAGEPAPVVLPNLAALLGPFLRLPFPLVTGARRRAPPLTPPHSSGSDSSDHDSLFDAVTDHDSEEDPYNTDNDGDSDFNVNEW